MDIFETTQRYREIQNACKVIYGDRWEETKAKWEGVLKKHHEEHKTTNLLASAIRLCEQEKDERVQLVLLWSAI